MFLRLTIFVKEMRQYLPFVLLLTYKQLSAIQNPLSFATEKQE